MNLSTKKIIIRNTSSFGSSKANSIKKSIRRRKNNKSMINIDTSIIKKDSIKVNKNPIDYDKISFLSNANLNIIKILNNCANKESLINKSSFLEDLKEKSILSITKRKRNRSRLKKNNGKKIKKSEKSISNKNNNKYNLNKSINTDVENVKFKHSTTIGTESFISSNNSFKKISEKEIFSGKNNNIHHKISLKKISGKSLNYKINSKRMNLLSPIKLRKVKNLRPRSRSILFSNNSIDKGINSSSTISKDHVFCKPRKKYKSNRNITGIMNDINIQQMKENIEPEVNLIQLKRQISKLKKTIRMRISSKDVRKNAKISEISEAHLNKSADKYSEINSSNYKSNLIKKTSSEMKVVNNDSNNEADKYRVLTKKKYLYDSIDDEEEKDELMDYYISPNSIYTKIFDILLFLSSLFYLIYVPYLISFNFFQKENNIWMIILVIIDIIYIIDIIINFFRAYQNFDENLVKKSKLIFMHYIKTWFIIDFIQAIPYFLLITFLEHIKKGNINNYLNTFTYSSHTIDEKWYLLFLIKLIKVYKMLNYNSTIDYLSEIFTQNEFLDDYGGFIVTIFLTLCILNLATFLFIFLGMNSYPGWIIKINIQDESYLNIYLTSVYFVIVTITTVGYGDITGNSISEIVFQVFLLIVGTIAYSFIISYISNYIVKNNKKSMTFEKNLEILNEIKRHHPNMKKSIYNDVLRNLHNEQLYEKKDKHILLDCLPYSLKNKLIMEMYRTIIKYFVFFKDIDNSDFIVKVVTSLKPLVSIKGDIVIQEGDFIKEIIFVKKGIISLNISIDLEHPEISLKKYLSHERIGNFSLSFINSIFDNNNKEKSKKNKIISLDQSLRSILTGNLENIESPLSNIKNKEIKIEEIKIIEIRKNEHFGDALMFLNEQCPLFAKVRTKKAELLILRKMEAIEIYSIYPNIWKRINKKSLFNMEQIYLKIKKIIFELSDRYGFDIEKAFPNKKNLLIKNKKEKEKKQNQNQNKIIELKEVRVEKEENEKNKNSINNDQNEIKDRKERKVRFTKDLNKNKEKQIKNRKSKNEMEIDCKKLKIKITINSENENENSFDKRKQSINLNNNDNMTFYRENSFFKEKSSINKDINNTIKSDRNKISPLMQKLDNIIYVDKIIKTDAKTSSSKNNCDGEDEYIEREINDEIYQNEIFDYNQKQSYVATKNSLLFRQESIKLNDLLNSNANNSNSFGLNNQSLKRSLLTKNENFELHTFSNLSSTKEGDFQLNSSYDNINKLSNNTYIKDVNLQTKTKDFIINECNNNRSLFKKSDNFLKLPGTPKNFDTIKSNINEKRNSNQKVVRYSEGEFPQNFNLNNFTNTFNRAINKSFNEENKFDKKGTVKIRKDKNLSFSPKNCVLKKLPKSSSSKSILKLKSLKITSIDNANNKLKKKIVRKKALNLNQKLNTISKNIRNMSNSINNPNEFYMNFFNNIIQKENRSVYEEEKEEKFKKKYSPIKDIKTVLSFKESNKVINVFEDEKSKNT